MNGITSVSHQEVVGGLEGVSHPKRRVSGDYKE
jgi:hypothetical protein